MNITIRGSKATVIGMKEKVIFIDINDVDESEIIKDFTTKQIVNSVDVDDLLDEIGIDAVKDHFNLIDNVD